MAAVHVIGEYNVTLMPLSRSMPTLAHPLRRLKLLVGQWLTPARRALMISTSSSSRCTACARIVFSRSSPNASYTPAYVVSFVFVVAAFGFESVCVCEGAVSWFCDSEGRRGEGVAEGYVSVERLFCGDW